MDVSIAAVENTLLSENDVGQFSDRLFGSNGKVEIDPEKNFEDADGEDEVEEPEERCKLCGKSCYCANKLMTDHIKRCLTTMKSSKKPCKHFLRDPMVVSLNLDDYLIQDIYTWQPEKMMPNGRSLVCWDSSCRGREGTRFKDLLR